MLGLAARQIPKAKVSQFVKLDAWLVFVFDDESVFSRVYIFVHVMWCGRGVCTLKTMPDSFVVSLKYVEFKVVVLE